MDAPFSFHLNGSRLRAGNHMGVSNSAEAPAKFHCHSFIMKRAHEEGMLPHVRLHLKSMMVFQQNPFVSNVNKEEFDCKLSIHHAYMTIYECTICHDPSPKKGEMLYRM